MAFTSWYRAIYQCGIACLYDQLNYNLTVDSGPDYWQSAESQQIHKWNWDTLVCLSHKHDRTTATENFDESPLVHFVLWSVNNVYHNNNIIKHGHITIT